LASMNIKLPTSLLMSLRHLYPAPPARTTFKSSYFNTFSCRALIFRYPIVVSLWIATLSRGSCSQSPYLALHEHSEILY
jgi:hypothetical protein